MVRWSSVSADEAAREVRVRCFVCGKWKRLCDLTVDLDGPAFQAYYCEECKEDKDCEPEED